MDNRSALGWGTEAPQELIVNSIRHQALSKCVVTETDALLWLTIDKEAPRF